MPSRNTHEFTKNEVSNIQSCNLKLEEALRIYFEGETSTIPASYLAVTTFINFNSYIKDTSIRMQTPIIAYQLHKEHIMIGQPIFITYTDWHHWDGYNGNYNAGYTITNWNDDIPFITKEGEELDSSELTFATPEEAVKFLTTKLDFNILED